MKRKLYFDKLASILELAQTETPPFFKKLRLIGLVEITIGTTIMMAPISDAANLWAIAGYAILNGY